MGSAEAESAVAEVAVPRNVPKTFDYTVPPELRGRLALGMRVRVPFGSETLTGMVVALKSDSDYPGTLQALEAAVDPRPVLGESELALARWMSGHYCTPLGLVLAAMAPSRLRRREPATRRHVRLAQSLDATLALFEELSGRAPQQAAILQTLVAREAEPEVGELLEEVGCSRAPLRALADRGGIEWVDRPVTADDREPSRQQHRPSGHKPQERELTAEQREALDALREGIDRRRGRFLLQGVNASGKTEVYLQAVQHALEAGRGALLIVPEIALTPQTIARVRARFGTDVALYHSGLTPAQRQREWTRLVEGEARVVVGVRAAVLAPVRDLGLIIVDEEHERTYKQTDPAPRYHARDVALKRAEIENAVVALGSATPAAETYHRAQRGGLQRLALTERVVGGPPPHVATIDLEGGSAVLSRRLRTAIAHRLERGEQSLVLLNRRGFATCVLCRHCRRTQTCRRCGITLVYHAHGQRLVCHTCGAHRPVRACRACGARRLAFIGQGTEQAERVLEDAFPEARLRRMDADAIGRGDHGPMLEAFRRREIDILLGTQMIGLGLDIPGVTLVGILSADTILDLPDFRAGERTFQLLSQAIGRAGRGPHESEVLIQTNHPSHYAIRCAVEGDYKAFMATELELRESLGYPPFTRLVKLTSEDRDEARARSQADDLLRQLQASHQKGLEVLGPFPALPYRLRGTYRWQLVLKTKAIDRTVAHLRSLLDGGSRRERVKVDVDPEHLAL